MAVVKLFGNLRLAADSAVLELPGETVQALLHALITTKPQLQTDLFAEGKLQPHVRVMVNGRAIELVNGLETAVSPQDQIAIFPPIAGG